VTQRRKRKVTTQPRDAQMATASATGRIVLRQIRRDLAARNHLLDQTPSEETRAQGDYAYVTPPRDVDHHQLIRVWKNCTPAPIDTLLAHERISKRQHAAAHQYRDDHARAGLERPLVANYDGGGGSPSATPNYAGMMASTVAQYAARKRLREARKTIPMRLLIRFDAIVIEERTLREVAEECGFKGAAAPRIGAEWLRICCDQLADWYRIA
jgi:hypothetical protein